MLFRSSKLMVTMRLQKQPARFARDRIFELADLRKAPVRDLDVDLALSAVWGQSKSIEGEVAGGLSSSGGPGSELIRRTVAWVVDVSGRGLGRMSKTWTPASHCALSSFTPSLWPLIASLTVLLGLASLLLVCSNAFSPLLVSSFACSRICFSS